MVRSGAGHRTPTSHPKVAGMMFLIEPFPACPWDNPCVEPLIYLLPWGISP